MSEASAEVFGNRAGIPAKSRCLDGHFPGNPVVPGAVILSVLAAHLAGSGRTIDRVLRMKFQRILRPDVPFEVRLTHAAGTSRAEWHDERGVFATARLTLRHEDG